MKIVIRSKSDNNYCIHESMDIDGKIEHECQTSKGEKCADNTRLGQAA